MDEDGAESGADLSELFGRIIGAVIGIDGFGSAAFVEGVLEAIDEILAVVGMVESSVSDDARGIVNEGDEENLASRCALGRVGMIMEPEVGAVEGVDLPEVVGMGLGKGEAAFGLVGLLSLEEVVFVDGAAEGVGCDLVAA